MFTSLYVGKLLHEVKRQLEEDVDDVTRTDRHLKDLLYMEHRAQVILV